jgi:hypothetical protein
MIKDLNFHVKKNLLHHRVEIGHHHLFIAALGALKARSTGQRLLAQ